MTNIHNNDSSSLVVQRLVNDAWKTDLQNEAKAIASCQKSQDEKVREIFTTFKGCQTIEDFHSLSEYTIESLRQAAVALQNPETEMAVSLNPHAFCLVERAKDMNTQNQLGVDLSSVGAELTAYADELQKLYEQLELAAKIRVNKVTVNDVVESVGCVLAAGNKGLSAEIEASLIKGEVVLFDKEGHLIDLGIYQEGSFTEYMASKLLPLLLQATSSSNQSKNKQYEDNVSDILYQFKEIMAGKVTAKERGEGFAEFMEYLETSEQGQKVAFMLKAMSPQLGNVVKNKVISLAEIAGGDAKGRAKVGASSSGRLVEIHLNKEQGAKVVLRNSVETTFYATPFTIVTTLGTGEKASVRLEVEQKDMTPRYKVFSNAAALAGIENWMHVDNQGFSQALIVGNVHGEIAQINSKKALRDEVFTSSEEILKRMHSMGTCVHMSKEVIAQLIVKRALMTKDLLEAVSQDDQSVAEKLLMSVYDVHAVEDLPVEVKDAMRMFLDPDKGSLGDVVQQKLLLEQYKNVVKMLGTQNMDKNYLRFANQFANAMALHQSEWKMILPNMKPARGLITNLEKQFNFLGFYHLSKEDVAMMMNAALVTGVMKGTEAKDFDLANGFVQAHALKALGPYGAEVMGPVVVQERAKIAEMKAKELEFAKLCLEYDHMSHFSDQLRVRTLEMLNLIVEYGTDVLGAKNMTLDTLVQSFGAYEAFGGDYYQGSIPYHRIVDALEDPETNFRTTMWICANLDYFYEPFFSYKFPDNETQIDKFEKFIKEKHPEADWIAFDKIHAQFNISQAVLKTRKETRLELHDQEGLSLFHPRHPLTTHARESSFKERVPRVSIEHTFDMQQELEKEVELRKRDVDQQSYMPLSIWEIERHNPELYLKLSGKYDLSTKEGRAEAMKDGEVHGKTIETKWGSGGAVWIMNEGKLVDKANPTKEYESSLPTQMLTRAVPMVAGISGHVEFVLHLASYFGLDKEDALIATYANLIMANAHTAAEILIGSSNFIDLVPMLDELEFNETLTPTLTKWVLYKMLDKIPEGDDKREALLQLIENLEK